MVTTYSGMTPTCAEACSDHGNGVMIDTCSSEKPASRNDCTKASSFTSLWNSAVMVSWSSVFILEYASVLPFSSHMEMIGTNLMASSRGAPRVRMIPP